MMLGATCLIALALFVFIPGALSQGAPLSHTGSLALSDATHTDIDITLTDNCVVSLVRVTADRITFHDRGTETSVTVYNCTIGGIIKIGDTHTESTIVVTDTSATQITFRTLRKMNRVHLLRNTFAATDTSSSEAAIVLRTIDRCVDCLVQGNRLTSPAYAIRMGNCLDMATPFRILDNDIRASSLSASTPKVRGVYITASSGLFEASVVIRNNTIVVNASVAGSTATASAVYLSLDLEKGAGLVVEGNRVIAEAPEGTGELVALILSVSSTAAVTITGNEFVAKPSAGVEVLSIGPVTGTAPELPTIVVTDNNITATGTTSDGIARGIYFKSDVAGAAVIAVTHNALVFAGPAQTHTGSIVTFRENVAGARNLSIAFNTMQMDVGLSGAQAVAFPRTDIRQQLTDSRFEFVGNVVDLTRGTSTDSYALHMRLDGARSVIVVDNNTIISNAAQKLTASLHLPFTLTGSSLLMRHTAAVQQEAFAFAPPSIALSNTTVSFDCNTLDGTEVTSVAGVAAVFIPCVTPTQTIPRSRTPSHPQPATAPPLPQPVCTVTTVAGADGSSGSAVGEPGDARFNEPMGISYDPMLDSFFVANHAGNRLARLHRSSGLTSTVFEGTGYVDGAVSGAKAEKIYNIVRLRGDAPRFAFGDGQPSLRLFNADTNTVSFIAGGTAISADGVGATGTFRWISGITALRAEPDRVIVTDHTDHCLRSAVLSTQAVTTVGGLCGTAGYDVRGGTDSRWNGPFDPSEALRDGALYVPEMLNRVVRLMNASGESSLVAGSPGAPAMIVDGPALTTARFRYPATCRTSRDALFIVEGMSSAVRVLHFATDYVVTLVSGYQGAADGPAPSIARMWAPHFADLDCDGALYVTEFLRHTVRKLECTWPAAEDTRSLLPQCEAKLRGPQFECSVETIGAINAPGSVAGDYSDARLNSPFGMAHDPGSNELHIAAYGDSAMFTAHLDGRFALRTFGAATMAVGPFATAGAHTLYNMAKVPGSGHKFLAINNDNGAPSVRIIDTAAKTVAFVAGGSVGIADGTGSGASFARTAGIAFFKEDPTTAFITDQNRNCIRSVVVATGDVATPSGVCGPADWTNAGYNPAAGAAAQWSYPFELAQANGTRRMYVADANNRVVRLWDHVTGLSPAIAGKVGAAGVSDGPGLGTARFMRPVALSVASDVVYIGDTWHGLRALLLSDDYVVTISGPKPAVSKDGALPSTGRIKVDHFQEVDCDGNLYVSDYESNAVRTVKCKWPGRVAHSEAHGCDVRRQRDAFPFQCDVSTVGKIGVSGKLGGKFDTARFDAPSGMAFDPATKELLSVDHNTHALFSVHVPSEFVQVLAEGDSQIDGAFGTAGIQAPYNIHKIPGLDHKFLTISKGNGAPHLRRVDTAQRTVAFVAGSTVGSLDGNGAAAQFRDVSDILVLVEDLDVAYLPDHTDNCIRRVQLSSGAVTTPSGTCGSGGAYDLSAGAAARWWHPSEVAQANGTRRMYVADSDNNVVRLYDTVSGLSPLIAGQLRVSHRSDGPALIAAFVRPSSVRVTKDVLYIGDHIGGLRALVLAYDYVVSISDIAPTAAYPATTATSRDGALPHVGRMRMNHFQEVDCDGNLYVADDESNVVRTVKCSWPGLDINASYVGCAERHVEPEFQCDISTVGKIGELGNVRGEYDATRLNNPFGMAYDPGTDELMVVDFGSSAIAAAHVRGQYTSLVVDGFNQVNGDFATAGMSSPYNIHKIPGLDHRFLTISNGNGAPHLRLVDTTLRNVSFIAGSTAGSADGTGATAQFHWAPAIVVLTEDTDVAYLTERDHNCIRRVQLSSGAVTTPSGTCGSGGGYDPSAGATAKWSHPFEAVQANGTRRMYVADTYTRVVRLYDTVTGLSPAIAGRVYDWIPKDGPAHIAAFRSPAALALARDVLYVGDVRNGLRALVLPTDYVVSLSGPSTSAVWSSPADESIDGPLPHVGRIRIANFQEVDCDGNLYVSDYESNVMRIVKCKWPGLDVNASYVGCAERKARLQPQCKLGSIGKIGDKAAAAPVTGSWNATRFNEPAGIAYDSATGALHIADVEGNSVVVAHIDSRTTRTLFAGATDTEGPMSTAGALRPYDITKVTDLSRFTFTTDGAAARLRSYDLSTQATSFVAGGVQAAGAVADGIGAVVTFSDMGGFRFLRGDPDVAYGADRGGHSIRRLRLSTGEVTTVSGDGTVGFDASAGTAGRWNGPSQVTQAHDAALYYAADTENSVVRLFNTTDTTSPVFIGQPGQRQRADGPLTTSARLTTPTTLSLTKDVLYIGEGGHGLRALLLTAGYVITIAPVGLSDATSRDGELAHPARLRTAQFSDTDCDGGLYVSDSESSAVRTVQCDWPSDLSLSSPGPSCAARVTIPFQCTLSSVGDGTEADVDGPFATAQFSNPMGLAFDPSWGSFLHMSWSGHAVRQIDIRAGEVKTLYSGTNTTTGPFAASGGSRVYNAQRLPGDGHHRFLVTHADSHPMVRLVDVAARTTEHIAGGTAGTNDGVESAAQFGRPASIVFLRHDASTAFITDDLNHCIRRLVLATKTVTTMSGVCDPSGPGFNLGPGSTAWWNRPFEAAQATGMDKIYVPEYLNFVVRILDTTDGSSSVVAGGQGIAARIDGPATSVARFEYPATVAVTQDVVYIGEGMKPHLRALILSLDYVVTIVTGLAESVDGTAPGPARLRTPHFMDTDCEGRLWIGDFLANRIRRVECTWPGINANATSPACPNVEAQPTPTAAATASPTAVPTATGTPTATAFPAATHSVSSTPSVPPTRSATALPTSTVSPAPTASGTASQTTTPGRSATPSVSLSPSLSPASTPTASHAPTPTATPRNTPSVTTTGTHSLDVPATASGSPSRTNTTAPTVTETTHPTATASAAASATHSYPTTSATATPPRTVSASRTRTVPGVPTPSLSSSSTPTADRPRTPSASSTSSRTSPRSRSGSAAPTATPTPSNHGTLSASMHPSPTLSSRPTTTPSTSASKTPSPVASLSVSPRSTETILPRPTRTPTSPITPPTSATTTPNRSATIAPSTTRTRTPSASSTPSVSGTPTLRPPSTATPEASPSGTAAATPSTTPSRSPAVTGTTTNLTSQSFTATVLPAATATPTTQVTVTTAPTNTTTSSLSPNATATVGRKEHRTSTPTPNATGTLSSLYTRSAVVTPTLEPLVLPPSSPPPVRRSLSGVFTQMFDPDRRCIKLIILAVGSILLPALVLVAHSVFFTIARRLLSLDTDEKDEHKGTAPLDTPVKTVPDKRTEPSDEDRDATRSAGSTDKTSALSPSTTNGSTGPFESAMSEKHSGAGTGASALSWWQFALVEHVWAGLVFFPANGLRKGHGVPQAAVWAARVPVITAIVAVFVDSSFGHWDGAVPAVLFGFAAAGAATALQPLLSWGWRSTVVVPGRLLRCVPLLDRGPQDLVVFGVPRYRQTIGVSKATYERLDDLTVARPDGQEPAPAVGIDSPMKVASEPATAVEAFSLPNASVPTDRADSAPHVTSVREVSCNLDDFQDDALVVGDVSPMSARSVECREDSAACDSDIAIDVVPTTADPFTAGSRSSGRSHSAKRSPVMGGRWKRRPPPASPHVSSLFLHETSHRERSILREPSRTVASRLGIAVASAAGTLCFLAAVVVTLLWAAPWCAIKNNPRWVAFRASLLSAALWDILAMQPLHGALRGLFVWFVSEDDEDHSGSFDHPFQWEGLSVWSPQPKKSEKKPIAVM